MWLIRILLLSSGTSKSPSVGSRYKSASGVESTKTPGGRFQADPMIHRAAETLFAPQVPLRRLHRDVSQQELNLLQFTTGLMAKTGTRPPEIVRCEARNLIVLCFLLHDTPNDLGAEPCAPDPASLVDRTKDRAGYNPSGSHPRVNSGFHPIWDRNSGYVANHSRIERDPGFRAMPCDEFSDRRFVVNFETSGCSIRLTLIAQDRAFSGQACVSVCDLSCSLPLVRSPFVVANSMTLMSI